MERFRAWGAQPVNFGEIVLRVETAAMYGLSVLSHTARSAAGAAEALST
jgi:16S rRNA U1498 N3-methylase RsmE